MHSPVPTIACMLPLPQRAASRSVAVIACLAQATALASHMDRCGTLSFADCKRKLRHLDPTKRRALVDDEVLAMDLGSQMDQVLAVVAFGVDRACLDCGKMAPLQSGAIVATLKVAGGQVYERIRLKMKPAAVLKAESGAVESQQ